GLRLEHCLAGVERERALGLAVGVAFGAMGLDQRDDIMGEVDGRPAGSVALRVRCRPGDQAEAHPGPDHDRAPGRPGSTVPSSLPLMSLRGCCVSGRPGPPPGERPARPAALASVRPERCHRSGAVAARPARPQSVNSKLNVLEPLFTVRFKPEVLGFSYFSGT